MVTNPNLFGGEYAKGVNTAAILSGDTVLAGLWRVEQAFEDKAIFKKFNYVSRLAVGDLCTVAAGATSSTMSDFEVQLTTFSISDKLCKHSFDTTNYAMNQQKGIFNKTVPTEVLQAYIMQMALAETANLESLRWIGDTTSVVAPFDLQDGVVTKAIASGSTIQVAPTVAGDSLLPAKVAIEINKVLAATPAAVRMQANFKLLVSPEVFFAYEAYLASNGLTGLNTSILAGALTNNLQNPSLIFAGYFTNTRIPMYIVPALSGSNGVNVTNDIIIAGNFSNDDKGNLLYATDALGDQANIIVQDRQAVFVNDPNIDIVWSFRQGMTIAREEEFVIYHRN